MSSIRYQLYTLVLLGALHLNAAEPLPRVLLLGDSIYNQPAAVVAKALKGRVDVVFPAIQPGEVRNSQTVLHSIKTLLGDAPWDLIYVNVGLGDLVYRAPNMTSFRILPQKAGGVRTTSPQDYEKNLRQLIQHLKGTGAIVIWASTTPIRHSSTGVFEMESEIEYNAIAARVMAEEKVPINDMYTHVRSLIDMTKPAGHGADPFTFDKKPVEPFVIECIQRALNLPVEESEVPAQ